MDSDTDPAGPAALDPELVALLRCPETRQRLSIAPPGMLAGKTDCGGAPLEAALIREDGAILYPVRSGIPVLLVEESIAPN